MSADEQKHVPHIREMTREQLIEHVGDLGWMILDIDQHISFTEEMLRDDLRPAARLRAMEMVRELGGVVYGDYDSAPCRQIPGVTVFGADGLRHPEVF